MSKSLRTWILFAAALLSPAMGNAQQCRHEWPEGTPSIGLALGGGGARGFAHVGVLQALEELRVPYQYIAGTSMGSIVGGLAATGMNPQEVASVIETADWKDLFTDRSPRKDLPARRKADDQLGLFGPKLGVGQDSTLLPAGVVAGQKILFLLETTTSQRTQADDFNRLPVPFRAVATDIVTGEMVVLEDGALSGAMRASMAVPGVFDPVPVGESLLVDGGLTRNLPVDVVRDLGAEVVIAVDVGTPLLEAGDIRHVLSIVEQLGSLMVVQNTVLQAATLTERDILIRPQLGREITSASFESFSEAAPIGHAAAMEQAGALSRLSLSEQDYARWRASVEGCVTGSPVIHFVRLDNQSRFEDAVIEDLLHIPIGEPLDVEKMNQELRLIYGLGFIRIARYRIVEEGGVHGVEVTVLQDQRGTDLIETGMTISGGGQGTQINVQAGYLKTDLDPYGSEARAVVQVGNDFGLAADVYKYLGDNRRYYFWPRVSLSRRDLLIYNPTGQALGEASIDEGLLGLSIGREFDRYATLSLGLKRFVGSVDVTIGVPGDYSHYNGAELGASLVYDRIDDLFLPSRGLLFSVNYDDSIEWLGADAPYEQVRSGFIYSMTHGRHNLLLTGRYNTTLDDDAPIYALFTGGGFLNMSGFQPDELVGQHFGMAGAGYRLQLGQSKFTPGYAGFTVEYGNAANDRGDIWDEAILNGSLYFAYSTPLGPVYLGYGYNADRSGVFFLRLGAVFTGGNLGRR